MNPTPSTEIEELAKKAIEAARHSREDYGLDTPGWTGAEVAKRWAMDEYRTAATPEAWLTLSARVRELEEALEAFTPKPIDEVKNYKGMIFYMKPKAHGGWAIGLAYRSVKDKLINEISSGWDEVVDAKFFIPLSAIPSPPVRMKQGDKP